VAAVRGRDSSRGEPGGRLGSADVFYDARDIPGQTMPEDFYEPWLAASRHVHISIADFARKVIPVARRLGIPISTDLHAWTKGEHHRDFAHSADVVFLSAAALDARRDEVMADLLGTDVPRSWWRPTVPTGRISPSVASTASGTFPL